MAKQNQSKTNEQTTDHTTTTNTPEAVQSGSKLNQVISHAEHIAKLGEEAVKAAESERQKIMDYLRGFAEKVKNDEPMVHGAALEIINMIHNKWHHTPPTP